MNRLGENFTRDEAIQIRIALMAREDHLEKLTGILSPDGDAEIRSMRRLVTRLLDEFTPRAFSR